MSYRLIAALAAVALPLVLRGHPLTAHTYSPDYQIFELFGFSGALFLIFNAWLDLRRSRGRAPGEYVPVLLFCLVGFSALGLISEYSSKAWDYACYEQAAGAILTGKSPYGGCYIYPPLLAQAFALINRAIAQSGQYFLNRSLSQESIWGLIFYFYQCLQFFLVLAIYDLCRRFMRKLGHEDTSGLVLITLIFLVNTPLLRTIRHNQVNLWVLAIVLSAVLLMPRHPFAAGLAIALGTHLKLYPILLVIPCIMTKRYRAIVGAIVGIVILLALGTKFGLDTATWSDFLSFSTQYRGGTVYRDNSIHSLVHNTWRWVSYLATGKAQASFTGVRAIVLGIDALVIGYFAVRFWTRWKHAPTEDAQQDDTPVLYAYAMEILAATLLLSPMVWEHHYVYVIPFAIWAALAQGQEPTLRAITAIALMFLLPTFDVFPFSYHRLLGLLLMLNVSAPWSTRRPAEQSPDPAL